MTELVDERAAGEGLADGHAEQQVLADGRLAVVPLRIERLDQRRHAAVLELLAQQVTRLDDARGELRIALGVDGAGQSETIGVVAQI